MIIVIMIVIVVIVIMIIRIVKVIVLLKGIIKDIGLISRLAQQPQCGRVCVRTCLYV
jgi:hypothetical protein